MDDVPVPTSQAIIHLSAAFAFLLALVVTGCSKKEEVTAPTPVPAQEQPEAVTPSQPLTPSPVPNRPRVEPAQMAAPVQAPSPAVADMSGTLQKLTSALRKWCIQHKTVPKSFEQFAATGAAGPIPPAPAGEKFAIEPKTLQVILVKQ